MAKNRTSNIINQNLKLPLTNFEQLIKEFPIIIDIQDGDGEIPSTRVVIRKTIIFDDGKKKSKNIKHKQNPTTFILQKNSNFPVLVDFQILSIET